jgi:alpha-D-xyloside xylohydrolase
MAFDFIDDPRARSISDQFMFGESFLVAPLYTLDSSRSYYLPSLAQGCCNSSTWHDFYTGRVMEPGLYHAQNVSPDATLLFVRSSIVVLAPKSQHVHDLAALKSLEVRIYCGKDSMFTLFEDDGVDPDPLRPSTTIKFEWSEKSLQLRIGKRQGKQYPGMPESRVIHIVLVRPNHGIGVDETLDADARVTYDGQELTVDLHEAYRYASGYRNTSNLVGTEDKSSGKVSS